MGNKIQSPITKGHRMERDLISVNPAAFSPPCPPMLDPTMAGRDYAHRERSLLGLTGFLPTALARNIVSLSGGPTFFVGTKPKGGVGRSHLSPQSHGRLRFKVDGRTSEMASMSGVPTGLSKTGLAIARFKPRSGDRN